MREYLLRLVKPGDILVYSGTGFFSRLIKFKTASEWTHVAVYIGDGKIREFHEKHGAHEGVFAVKNLSMIRRRLGVWERSKSDAYWAEVKDQTYDYLGILFSFYARKQGRENNKMWCSEYLVRDDRVSVDGGKLFADDVDADAISPADVAKSPSSTVVWQAKEGHR